MPLLNSRALLAPRLLCTAAVLALSTQAFGAGGLNGPNGTNGSTGPTGPGTPAAPALPAAAAAAAGSTGSAGAVGSIGSSTSTKAQDPTLLHRGRRYELQPNDQIEVDFRLSPEFNATVPVEPDGYITLPQLGQVDVGNLTITEATQRIQQAASQRLNAPEVTVELKSFQPPYLIVGGQVNAPGRVLIQGPVSALQAVQLAGGFKDGAKTNQIILVRRIDKNTAETKLINYSYILHHYKANEDIDLEAGDMLYVPQNMVTKIAPYIKVVSWGFYFNPLDF